MLFPYNINRRFAKLALDFDDFELAEIYDRPEMLSFEVEDRRVLWLVVSSGLKATDEDNDSSKIPESSPSSDDGEIESWLRSFIVYGE